MFDHMTSTILSFIKTSIVSISTQKQVDKEGDEMSYRVKLVIQVKTGKFRWVVSVRKHF